MILAEHLGWAPILEDFMVVFCDCSLSCVLPFASSLVGQCNAADMDKAVDQEQDHSEHTSLTRHRTPMNTLIVGASKTTEKQPYIPKTTNKRGSRHDATTLNLHDGMRTTCPTACRIERLLT
ncbi:uncharacterized protein N7469_003483 [Penicillium citrinum]|uniref:Uncharacterized protein n=2 Tax=Penicillium TaxID=5073 RepID=A0A9W9P397_PENCI|nr:uncharacterized protein N7469_003483 [Penicillium citrinum]KAJ5234315.1 hypothetical protein N7469_003483 [Penicillium citrinum]KAJ5589925.1 hypothetical protein N7450_003897 [Penicillium hetheringtonii]